jgi:cytoskeleton protein RodZ
VSKSESRRAKKRAALSEQPVDNDLLSAESAQVSVLTSGKAALPPEVKEAAAVSEAPDQESPQEEMNQENSSEMEQSTSDTTLSAGTLLKEAREAAGFSIDDVSHLLKLAPRQVHALEQQNFDALPPRTFVRGFIRNYARLLDINADAVLEALPPETPQALSPAASSVKTPTHAMPVLSPYGEKTIQPQSWKWLLAVMVLAVIAAVFFFWPQITTLFPERPVAQAAHDDAMPVIIEEFAPPFISQESESGFTFTPIITPLSETSADPVASPAASPTESPAVTEHEEAELVLRFTGDSWVEVRDKHDRILYSAIAREGNERTLLGAPPFSLVFGNSNAATVTLRGEPVDLSDRSKQGVARLVLE